MKRLFTYIATLLLLAACSSEEAVIGDVTANEVVGIQVEIEDPKGIGDELISRASLAYDDAKDIMAFKWADDDVIGVFTYTEHTHSQQQKFSQVKGDPINTDNLRAFMTQDGALHVEKNYQYVSCFPYFADHQFDYTNIPVDYTGQRQMEPIDFSDYKQNPDTKYKESQPKASAHLSDYDFLCTGVTDPTPTGGIHFKLNRMGAIVRFWIVLDKNYNYVYDELQLVNNTKMFTTEATMDAEKMTLTPTPTKQSHIVSLKLGADGFDMTDVPENGKSSKFYYWNGSKHLGAIMAYMMLGPIDLKGTSNIETDPGYVENCVLYLVAHEKDDPKIKHYFKATGLSKPNLKPNIFYKWTVYPDKDTPIEVSEITVEEWREGTTFDNGNGNGTGSW